MLNVLAAARRARLARPALRRRATIGSGSRTACAASRSRSARPRLCRGRSGGRRAWSPRPRPRSRELGAHVEEVDPGLCRPARGLRGALVRRRRQPAAPLRREPAGARWTRAWSRSPPRAQRSRCWTISTAVARRGALGQQMRRFHERFDLLLTPTVPIAAFAAGSRAAGPGPPGALVRLGAVQPPVQPHPAAGRLGALRPDRRRPAGRPADRRPDARRCAGAARRPRVRGRPALADARGAPRGSA